ncbi:MAG: Ada metal-binding domain-containing protein [Gemmatimonadota bacterium]
MPLTQMIPVETGRARSTVPPLVLMGSDHATGYIRTSTDSSNLTVAAQPTALWHHAVDSRDPAYDGVFFVGITSTRIYCRPICPSRAARPERRRFFRSRDAAEQSGFRACRRCRPELARGQTPLDAVPRLARKAASTISAGALDGRSVKALALDLGMSDRQLRRALERELGTSPLALALTQRLLTATQLLTTTTTPVTRIAYASGFQSLRRFNAVFRERFAMSPSEWRRQTAAISPPPSPSRRSTAIRRSDGRTP